jgi:putative PIN family toxin of toxin-antitoxin system
MTPNVIIDTNVVVAGLISNLGAAFRILQLIGTGRFISNVSVPLILEYEYAINGLLGTKIVLSEARIDGLLDYICTSSRRVQIYFLWRPYLSDPRDDMLLELGIRVNAEYIITYNENDFKNVEQFGIQIIAPAQFLRLIGDTP